MIPDYDVHFGAIDAPPVDWARMDDADPDDEELKRTPASIIAILGFDPLDIAENDLAEDDAEFEAKHPRAENGQFGEGGGGKAIQNGITTPKKGTIKYDIWTIIAQLKKNTGEYPTAGHVKKYAAMAGTYPEFNDATIQGNLKTFKLYHAGVPLANGNGEGILDLAFKNNISLKTPKPKTSTEFAKAANMASPQEHVHKMAEEAGYAFEGNYNNIDYYKATNGNKVSYKPDTDSWKVWPLGEAGEGTISLNDYLEKNPLPKEAKKKPNVEPSKQVPATSTETAPKYGSAIPTDQFKFSSKGIPDESGFPAGIRKSISAYKGSGYQQINKAMRFETSFNDIDQSTMVHILNLQKAFQVVPPTQKDVQSKRNMSTDALKVMAKHAGITDLTHIAVGNIMQEEGIVSTSVRKDWHWSGAVRFNIAINKGSRAIDLSESINSGEGEILLPPGAKFKITGIKTGDETSSKQFEYEYDVELLQ
jgi:uncharacterized protein YejL (UPF0352 family)